MKTTEVRRKRRIEMRTSLSERKSNRRYCRGNGGGRGDSGGRNVGEAVEEEKVGNTPGTLLRTADAAAGIPDTPVAAALMGIPAVAELMDIPVADDVGGYRAIRNLKIDWIRREKITKK